MKKSFITFICLFVIVFCVPSVIVLVFSPKATNLESVRETTAKVDESLVPIKSEPVDITVSVYRMGKKEHEEINIEQYVKGVLSAEMPVDFELEALKAQAIAARTFTIKTLLSSDKLGIPAGANITDSTLHQVYKNQAELKKLWGNKYEVNIQKVNQAVNETQGLILTYKEEPIDALFFSTSNGYTENSENYWTTSIPYLRSTPSPWDKNSPKFMESKIFSVNEFETKIGAEIPKEGNIGSIVRTTSQRVSTVEINGKKLTGKDVREALGLNSSDFTFEREGNDITVNTKGNGHGVGMSQYGANGMAKEGKNYEDIVEHYYKDITIDDINSNQDILEGIAKANEK